MEDIDKAVSLLRQRLGPSLREVAEFRGETTVVLEGEAVVQACRALRPGGVFVATCPAGLWDNLSGRLKLHQDEFHATEFDRRRFEEVAQAGGLTPLRYQRFMFAPVGFLPYLRIPVPPGLAGACDACVRALRVFDFGFVNQLFVARRP
jgi:hypothetical protein